MQILFNPCMCPMLNFLCSGGTHCHLCMCVLQSWGKAIRYQRGSNKISDYNYYSYSSIICLDADRQTYLLQWHFEYFKTDVHLFAFAQNHSGTLKIITFFLVQVFFLGGGVVMRIALMYLIKSSYLSSFLKRSLSSQNDQRDILM